MTEPEARIAHVGIAVADLTEAVGFYRDVLGLEPSPPQTADGAQIVSVTMGDVEVELLTPESPEGPIAKFLAKRGPGIHHICYRVPDLEHTLAHHVTLPLDRRCPRSWAPGSEAVARPAHCGARPRREATP